MVMLDTVRLIERGHAICSVTVTANGALAPFLDSAGNLPAWFGLEIMAQTVGVSAASQAASGEADREADREVAGNEESRASSAQGMLLGTQRFTTEVPVFPAGAELFCEATLEQSSGALHSYACTIYLARFDRFSQAAESNLAQARVNIFQSQSPLAVNDNTTGDTA